MHNVQPEVSSETGGPAADEPLDEAGVALYRSRLEAALPELRERIAGAALRAGRGADDVTLVGVSKAHPPEAIEAAVRVGLTDLGENRVEELTRKRQRFSRADVTWHLIGHVQSRKSAAALQLADLFHALDSKKLAGRMSRQLSERGNALDVLLQVNTSGEASKGGFDYSGRDDGGAGIEQIHEVLGLPGLTIRGLMTMAPFTADEELVRTTFARLRELHERLRAETDYDGTELSMGMTSDFEIAIEEGSTLVRVGTALFGERK